MDVWVTGGCPSCDRTRTVVSGCEALRSLVSVTIRHLDAPDGEVPNEVVGGPAIVFMGTVIALGTPTCSDLVQRVLAMMKASPSRTKAGEPT